MHIAIARWPVILFIAAISTSGVCTVPLRAQSEYQSGYLDQSHGKRFYSPVYMGNYENGVTKRHYATVEQLNTGLGIACDIGEVTILSGTGDSIHVAFDHPLNTSMATTLLDVYQFNSDTYANQIRTLPWKVFAGDTLVFYRNPKLLLPQLNSDGSVKTEFDAAHTASDDTLRFRVILECDSTGQVLAELDTLTYYPYRSMSELALQGMLQRMEGQLPTNRVFRFGMPSEWIGRKVRLAMHPTFRAPGQDPYDGRLLLVQFFYMNRLSADFRFLADRDSALFHDAYMEYLSLMKSAKNAADPSGSAKSYDLELLHYGNALPTLCVKRASFENNDIVTVHCFSMNGKLVKKGEISFSSGASESRLSFSPLPPGGYLFVVRGGSGMSSKVLTLVR